MKFEYIILLVILFNVVTAYLQKRAKKQREQLKAEAAKSGSRVPASDPKHVRTVFYPPKKEVEGDEADELESFEGDDDEHTHSGGWHAEEEGEEHPVLRPPKPAQPAPASVSERPADRSGKPKEKVATLGKGLLEQLAKELGLRLPESESEPEIPKAPPPRPEAISHHVTTRFASGKTATTPLATPQTVVAGNSGKHSSAFAMDVLKLREAVILREILDKPVSMRAGRLK